MKEIPRFNHVALSVPADLLDWQGRVGEEETPGPSAAMAVGAVLAAACVAVVASAARGRAAALRGRPPR